jgi:hypothetical protein
MNKLKQTKRLLAIFFIVFLFQSTSSFFEAKAADAVCPVTSDGYLDHGSMLDSDGNVNGVGGYIIRVCQTEPTSITMYPYGLYICTAAPTAPTTTTATDLSNCFRVYEGDGTSAVEISSSSVSRPAGTFTVPPAGVYTHAVVWAKNLMGVKHFVQVDTDIAGSVSGDSGAAGYCWTVSGITTLNSAKANAICGATVDTDTYGTTYLDMECFDDACAYASATDVDDGEYYTPDEGSTYVPGTDWQYVSGVTSAISSTDSSGITRSTNAGFMIHDTLLLCAPSTCMTGTGVETGTSTEKSMWMAQTFPTPIDTGGKSPTSFYVNFQMATATLFDVSNGTSSAAWRQGPFYLEMGLEY